ncbi:MAG: helix-turn-helix domain-containing protein [Pseudomonadales bacterium]
MKQSTAIKSLAAMAHDGRLTLIRMLIKAGEQGVGAGTLARKARIAATTASAQLTALAQAGLVRSERQGRAVTYYADFTHLTKLMAFLMHDCCQGREDICAEILRRT